VLAAAALVADRLAIDARLWWQAGIAPVSSGAALAFADLTLDPLLELGLGGPGGARLAADLLVSGIELIAPLHEAAAHDV
jgi:nicotinate-nucleotide--dimethylbenzimidazole phosphoribosyltransferase